jgi:putative hydrolase
MRSNTQYNTIPFNRTAADLLRDTADLLGQQNANPFRINAYRRAAETLESLDTDARELLRKEGPTGLMQLPFIGQGLASAIEEIARNGRLSRLDRLRGALEPEALFQTIPGIGPGLAHAIHDSLEIDTLEALELAAHDGRLETVRGIGRRRTAAIRASLGSTLGRPRRWPTPSVATLPVETILDVDREYRTQAEAGNLPTIAPRRFNRDGKAWLPILHTDRDGWHFTVLFSNTARAHELGRTNDWVVAYFYDGDHREGQCTIVTETRGHLKGRRVVRGREAECAVYYRSSQSASIG